MGKLGDGRGRTLLSLFPVLSSNMVGLGTKSKEVGIPASPCSQMEHSESQVACRFPTYKHMPCSEKTGSVTLKLAQSPSTAWMELVVCTWKLPHPCPSMSPIQIELPAVFRNPGTAVRGYRETHKQGFLAKASGLDWRSPEITADCQSTKINSPG